MVEQYANQWRGTLAGMACLLVVALATGCVQSADAQAGEGGHDGTIQVAATVGMVADIVREVGGDRVAVTTIMGESVDPHGYTPTRNDLQLLRSADMVFYAGLMLEGQMGTILARAGDSKPVVAVTERIPGAYLLEKEEGGGQPDPHVWMDVAGWIQAVEVVRDALAGHDPDHAAHYTSRADAYGARLGDLDRYARERLATIPAGARVMITAHDAFGYMGRAYGLEVLGIQGISTESEAGLRDINRLVDLIVDRGVPAIFVESSVSDRNVRSLVEGARSRGHDVRVGGELFSDAMGPAGTYEGTYIGMIDHNVTTITRALGGDAPEGGMQGLLGGVEP